MISLYPHFFSRFRLLNLTVITQVSQTLHLTTGFTVSRGRTSVIRLQNKPPLPVAFECVAMVSGETVVMLGNDWQHILDDCIRVCLEGIIETKQL